MIQNTLQNSTSGNNNLASPIQRKNNKINNYIPEEIKSQDNDLRSVHYIGAFIVVAIIISIFMIAIFFYKKKILSIITPTKHKTKSNQSHQNYMSSDQDFVRACTLHANQQRDLDVL